MRNKWFPTLIAAAMLLLGGCAEKLTVQESDTPSEKQISEQALDGSVYETFIQDNRDDRYYALLPGADDEPVLVLARAATYVEASPPEYPESGYYASDVTLYRYEDGAVQEIDFFHSMCNIMIDTEHQILYTFWGGQGVEEDIAVRYAELREEDSDAYYDVLDIRIETDECSRNYEAITKAEYDRLKAEREESRCALQVFPIERDYTVLEPTLQTDTSVLVRAGGAQSVGNTVYLTFTEQLYETFSADQIRALSKGDVIVLEGDEVEITSISFEDFEDEGIRYYTANINNTYFLYSVSEETPELMYHADDNDGKFTSPGDTKTLPIERGTAFRDYLVKNEFDDNGPIPLVVAYSDIPDYFADSAICAGIEVKDGVIVSVWRDWHP